VPLSQGEPGSCGQFRSVDHAEPVKLAEFKHGRCGVLLEPPPARRSTARLIGDVAADPFIDGDVTQAQKEVAVLEPGCPDILVAVEWLRLQGSQATEKEFDLTHRQFIVQFVNASSFHFRFGTPVGRPTFAGRSASRFSPRSALCLTVSHPRMAARSGWATL